MEKLTLEQLEQRRGLYVDFFEALKRLENISEIEDFMRDDVMFDVDDTTFGSPLYTSDMNERLEQLEAEIAVRKKKIEQAALLEDATKWREYQASLKKQKVDDPKGEDVTQ